VRRSTEVDVFQKDGGAGTVQLLFLLKPEGADIERPKNRPLVKKYREDAEGGRGEGVRGRITSEGKGLH